YGDASVREIPLRDDLGADVERIVADECGRLIALRPLAFAEDVLGDSDFLGAAIFLGLGSLGLQRRLEADDVDGVTALASHQLGEIDREAEGVVELEGVLTGNRAVDRSRSLS